MRNRILACVLIAALLPLSGCITRTAPDGTVTTSVDSASAVLMLQTSLAYAQDALREWWAHKAEMEQAEFENGLRQRIQTIEAIQCVLNAALAKQKAAD